MAELDINELRTRRAHTITIVGRPDGAKLVLISPEERDATVTALEQAKRLRVAAGQARLAWRAGWEAADADNIWPTDLFEAFYATMAALGAVLDGIHEPARVDLSEGEDILAALERSEKAPAMDQVDRYWPLIAPGLKRVADLEETLNAIACGAADNRGVDYVWADLAAAALAGREPTEPRAVEWLAAVRRGLRYEEDSRG